MTIVRKLALKVSYIVVKFASPGCKEWAEGLAAEAECIEGDWSTLGWALGSARILLDYREKPLRSLADLPVVVHRYAESKRGISWAWVLLFSQAMTYASKFLATRNQLELMGCSMVVFGNLILGIFRLVEEHNRLKVPPAHDMPALIRFYKAELERMYDLFHSYKWTIAHSAFTIICVGLILAKRGGVRAHPGWDSFLALLWASVVPLYLYTRQTNQRRLEQLKALLAETSKTVSTDPLC
jgi:hypothetical protein